MTRPRSTLISIADTPWYHVVSRCVRRAFLCGEDQFSGQNFDHRRGWITQRVKQLASVFAIDVAAYAVMSNHYHLVLRVDAERAKNWSHNEVLRRWTQLFDGPMPVQQFLAAQEQGKTASFDADATIVARIDEWAQTYRARLMDISWFMRVLNETIAREANAEDQVTGRFWEGRFKSQALLDELAILTAMVYVDLNPIRAAMAETPEESEYTSVAERIEDIKPGRQHKKRRSAVPATSPSLAHNNVKKKGLKPTLPLRHERYLAKLPLQPLMPFSTAGQLHAAIPFNLEDYLELVEATGRCQHPNKRGKIPTYAPGLLQRLQLEPKHFIECSAKLLLHFGSAVGAPEALTARCAALQVKYLRGISAARRMAHQRAA